MPIDPSIALGYQPIKMENPIANTLAAQNVGVNALKMQEMQRGLAEENALRDLIKGGADINSPDTLRKMYEISPKQGIAFEKSRGELAKIKGESQKLMTENAKQATELYREQLPSVNTPQDMAAFITAQYNDPRIGTHLSQVRPLDQAIAAIPQDPMGFNKYKNQIALGMKDFITQTTVSANTAATVAATMRGQDMSRIPVGYRMNANKELEAIPGGPTTTTLAPKEIQAREAKYPMATQAVKTVESKADKLITDIETLKNHPGLPSITGTVYGRTPSVTSEGRAAQALYDSIVARGGFQELAAMRAASPTGGALGNVSNQEGQQLKDAFGTLNRTQDAADLRKQLGRVADDVRGAKQRVREAYDMTYEYKPSTTSSGGVSGGGKEDPLGIR
jgi:hypothetical protein